MSYGKLHPGSQNLFAFDFQIIFFQKKTKKIVRF